MEITLININCTKNTISPICSDILFNLSKQVAIEVKKQVILMVRFIILHGWYHFGV